MKLKVINLDRSPERMVKFIDRNPGLAIERLPAVDGGALGRERFIEEGVITPDNEYMPGALGCAMSHILLWRQCAAGSEPFHIAEDDLSCRTDFAAAAQACLDRLTDWDIVVWAYNLDWPVQARLAPGSGVAVVQYDYTSVQHDRFRAGRVTPFLAPLVSAAGTGCYSISPRGAARALADCLPIGNTGAQYIRESSLWGNSGIDVELSRHYAKWRAFVSLPFLAVAETDQISSTIRGHLEAIHDHQDANRVVTPQDVRLWRNIARTWRPPVLLAAADVVELNNAGLALEEAHRPHDALEYYDRALELRTDVMAVHFNRGNALLAMQRLEEALASYEAALALEPDDASALINKGVALDRLARFEEALVCLDRAIALKPDDAELAANRDLLVQRLKEIAATTAPEAEPSVENA